MLAQILNLTKALPLFQWEVVKPSEVAFRQDIRELCQGNVCRQYGKTWACPPGVGTVEECRDRCLQYDTMLVFTGKYPLEDSFDYEGMQQGHKAFKALARQLEAAVKPWLTDYLLLSNEGCDLCESCTYPAAPCRFPARLHPSIEGYGLLVSDLAKQAQVAYHNGENTVTYFGALLFHEK